ncbi:MAG TPA: HAD family hydrolase [Thermoanaerobaculia bacterium]|nr:HAD family hydrolase [Thermoanaerobaculia bacterium]
MLKAIAFDLWETLITGTPGQTREQETLRLVRIEQVLARRGHQATAFEIHDAYKALWHRCHELYWKVDVDVPTRRHIIHFLEALGLDPGAFSEEVLDEIESAYSIAALDVLPEVVPGAHQALEALRQLRLSIGLVSNTGRTPGSVLREVLGRAGLGEYLDAMVFSNEHGACKPRGSIFEELCRNLQVEPCDVLFVGDDLYADVFGAQRCGMKAVHFMPESKGVAVARPIEHGLTIIPDATIRSLAQLPAVVSGYLN